MFEIEQMQLGVTFRILRSGKDLKLMSSMIKGTFQDQTSKQFNRLPSTVRHEATLPSFCNSLRKELVMQANERLAT